MNKTIAIQYLKSLPRSWLPSSREGGKCGEPSNSELRRWLRKGSIRINGANPKPNGEITFPITELIFFFRGNQVTIIE